MTSAVSNTAPVTATPSQTTAPANAATQTSLLPSPGDVPTDPILMLFYCDTKQEQVSETSGEKEVENAQDLQQQALKKEQDAIQKEVDAAKHKSFWDKLGKICGDVAKAAAVVASVAAAVATCGAGSPLAVVAVAGATLSSAGFADSELHVLQKLGVNAQVANLLDAGMSAAGGGAALGVAAAVHATTAFMAGASVVSGIGTVGSGAATIGSGESQAAEERAQADQVSAQARQDDLRRTTDHVLEEMKSGSDQTTAELRTVADTKNIQEDTMSAAVAAQ
ncbi:MAG TPA: hypothetical protein VGG39_17765 [Polyangiaceae bacterium]